MTDWEVLENIDPYGEHRMDMRFALLSSQILMALGAKNSSTSKPYTPGELLLEFTEQPVVAQTPEQIESMFRTYARMHNSALAERRKGS